MKQSEDMQRMKKHTKKYSQSNSFSDGPPKGRHAKKTKKIITRIYEEEDE